MRRMIRISTTTPTPAATRRRTITVCWSSGSVPCAGRRGCGRSGAPAAGSSPADRARADVLDGRGSVSSPSSKNDKSCSLQGFRVHQYDWQPPWWGACKLPVRAKSPVATGRESPCGRGKRDPVRSTQTLVHTPGTAGREDLVEQPSPRERIARAPGRGRRGDAAARPVAPDRAAGLVLGRYSLRERLGAGGFGVVWRAHDELLGREVALKRISLPDGDSERASREAQAAARLSHPAIVALYEACAAPDAFYLISELVRGDTLARLIATGDLKDARVLQIGIALADALAHAHARGVIHRDVKPQNVLVPYEREDGPLAPRGAPAVAKLTDFGGARMAGDDVLTRTGDVLGTLAYMAPEQSDGAEVGEAVDLYSLALILYEAFSGVNPVRGPTPAATARRIGCQLEPLERARGALPRALTRPPACALAPAARDRGTLAELRGALAGTLEQVDAPATAR